jgi:hypothetical protein
MNSIQIATYIMGFIFGLGQMIDFQIMGRITASDFVVWLPMPYYLFSCRRILLSKRGLLVIALLGIYLFSVLISDYFAGCSLDQTFRGVLRILFTLAYTVFFIWLFLRNPKSLWAVLVGAAIGTPLILFRPGSYLEIYATEEGYGKWSAIYMPVILNILILVCCIIYRKFRLLATLLFFVTFLVLAPYVPRSMTMVGLLASQILMIEIVQGDRAFSKNASARRLRIFGFCVVIIASIGALYVAYIHAAPAGLLGEYQRGKFNEQTSSNQKVNPLELLMNGRNDLVSAVFAVRDHPILGFGSWNSAEWKIYKLKAMYARDAQISDAILEGMNLKVYSHHSTFFGEWAEGGIGVVFFWLFVIFCSIRLLFSLIMNDNLFLPFFILTIVNFYCNILISPMNIVFRMETGIIIAVYLLQFSPESPRYPLIFDWLPKNTLMRRNCLRGRPSARPYV